MYLVLIGSRIGDFNSWRKHPYVVVHYTRDKNNDAEIREYNPHGNWIPSPLKNAAKLARELEGAHTPGNTPIKRDNGGIIFCANNLTSHNAYFCSLLKLLLFRA